MWKRIATIFLISILAASCFKSAEKDSGASKTEGTNMSVVSEGGQTFLVDRTHNSVFQLQDGEFVQVPVITQQEITGKNGLRNFKNDIPDLIVTTDLKFYDGKLLYQVQVGPAFTPEYQAYLTAYFDALSKSKPLPSEPTTKYKNENWGLVVDKIGNSIDANLLDSDGFKIQTLSLPLMGPRTNLIGIDGKTRSSVRFDGSVAMTGGDFERIKSADVTYVLN